MIKKSLNVEVWENCGFHETPQEIVEEFSDFTLKKIELDWKKIHGNRSISVLDLFAGDGRLGNKIGERLSNHFNSICIDFVEINRSRINSIKPSVACFSIVNKNAFCWKTNNKFDIVVSNPPYRLLNVKLSKELGFSWDVTRKFSRNLYGLGIIRGLDLCKEGGALSVIAPFSWLKGIYCKDFRQEIAQRCSQVYIQAYNKRGIFFGINQDIGFQFFIKRQKHVKRKVKYEFSFNGLKSFRVSSVDLLNTSNILPNGLEIRVGPIVWNRNRNILTSKKTGTLPLIYGGNIRPNGNLDFKNSRYFGKQFIKKNELNSNNISEAPLILLRRTLRGIPGNWKIDSCIITDKFRCAVENHVILIKLPARNFQYFKIYNLLIDELSRYYYISGSPSISVQIVRDLLRKIINPKL